MTYSFSWIIQWTKWDIVLWFLFNIAHIEQHVTKDCGWRWGAPDPLLLCVHRWPKTSLIQKNYQPSTFSTLMSECVGVPILNRFVFWAIQNWSLCSGFCIFNNHIILGQKNDIAPNCSNTWKISGRIEDPWDKMR